VAIDPALIAHRLIGGQVKADLFGPDFKAAA